MTDDERTGQSRAAQADPLANVVALPRARPPKPPRRGLLRRRRPRRRRMRWLRLLAILIPLAFLALISFVFGVVLAFEPQVAPLTKQLYERFQTTANSLNTFVYGDAASGHQKIATLSSHNNEFSLTWQNVPLVMDHAIVAIEDKRFYTESGVDVRGIARAFIADVFHTGDGTQGASTITEQFVKRALNAEGHRTLFEKLKEAAMAFQLSHLWSKQQILAAYLNTAYYGSGAYGLEAAAKTYFGNDPGSPLYGCGANPSNNDPASLCVTYLTADEAALLAAAVNAPSDYNDLLDARQAEDRRDLVLLQMAKQGYLTPTGAADAEEASLPTSAEVESPSQEATNPSDGYFTSWVAAQLDSKHLNYQGIYGGGYRVDTTLDTDLQSAAQHIVDTTLPAGIGGPSASLVAIQTDDGEVRAMVGGYDYNQNSFNLATQAERQPGSAFKAFDLAAALESGYGPNSEIYSGPFTYPAGSQWSAGLPAWTVHNDEGAFAYEKVPLSEALAVSDNSVFARLSLEPTIGPPKIAQVAHDFGITTTISLNPPMVIGGLRIGVTPLDMAHAYETIANGGQLTSGSLTSYACAGGATDGYAWEGVEPKGETCPGPVGITSVKDPSDPAQDKSNVLRETPVYNYADDQTEISMMRGVLSPIGTAASAAIPGVDAWGKTGTTSNYVDAWFVGSIPKVGPTPALTVAVWVGYPNRFKEMTTNYGGKPVYGGTFPAQIWKAFMEQAMSIFERRAHGESGIAKDSTSSASTTAQSSSSAGSPSANTAPTGITAPAASSGTSAGATDTGTTDTGGATNGATSQSDTTPPPATGPTVTGGGGSTVPDSGSTTATPPPATTPASGSSSASGTPPSTGAGGGVSAPTGST